MKLLVHLQHKGHSPVMLTPMPDISSAGKQNSNIIRVSAKSTRQQHNCSAPDERVCPPFIGQDLKENHVSISLVRWEYLEYYAPVADFCLCSVTTTPLVAFVHVVVSGVCFEMARISTKLTSC